MKLKRFQNLTITLGSELQLYSQALATMMSQAPTTEGMDWEYMNQVMPLIEKLEEVGEADTEAIRFVCLTVDEWKMVCDRIKKVRWKVATPSAYYFVNRVLEAEDFEQH